MDAGDILDAAVSRYRENLPVLLGIHALAYAPFWLVVGVTAHVLASALPRLAAMEELEAAFVAAAERLAVGMVGGMFVLLSAVLVVEPIATGAVGRAVSGQVLGRRVGIAAAYRGLRGRTGSLVLTALIRGSAAYGAYSIASLAASGASLALTGAGVFGGVLVVVLHLAALGVGNVVFVLLGFVGQIVAIERRGAADALSRSWRLVSGRLWPTVGVVGLLVLLVGALGGVVQGPLWVVAAYWAPRHGGPESAAALIAIIGVASLLVTPVLAIGATLLYYDLRVRREGFDVDMMAASMGSGERSG